MADVDGLLQAATVWEKNFNKPLSLGAKARVAVVTCMDSRLIPEAMFGFGVGDAEVRSSAADLFRRNITFWQVSSAPENEIVKCRSSEMPVAGSQQMSSGTLLNDWKCVLLLQDGDTCLIDINPCLSSICSFDQSQKCMGQASEHGLFCKH